ncbi:MAG: sialate O-acetylesterase [Lachnospiraceae bacterium]|nr:sialate O-acetylesterase [Lachnospiraceae bacterium]
MSTIRLARIFGNGAVLQRGLPIHIWGFAGPGTGVEIKFAEKRQECTADECGRFDAEFPAMPAGGPYSIEAGCAGGRCESRGIMVGDVIMVSGQSNMEFPMSRVRETYPGEWGLSDDLIRTFKVEENPVFGREIEDVLTGEWKSVSKETIDAFSAVGYFTAKHMRKCDGVAVGLVDVTFGGAPIESFMSEEMLAGYDEALSVAETFSDDAYLAKVLDDNVRNADSWHEALDAADAGAGHYEDGVKILREGRDIMLPDFFSDTELCGYIGSVWIARSFTVPEEYAGRSAAVWFGTLVDFDSCYINGTFVGNTEYTYPPRRYRVPEGVIHSGENTIVLRIGIERGFGRVTPGKLYGIVYGDCVRHTDGFNETLEGAEKIIYLSGIWKYLKGTRCEPPAEPTFVTWLPTAIYHGMFAPLAGFAIKAFAFYQGESNCPRNHEYADLTGRFIKGIRKLWNYDIPYICVQLPEFNARMEEISYDGGRAWRGLMAAQESCMDIPGFYLVKSYGTGELNDLHPQRKEPIGKAIADVIGTL